MTNTVEIEGEVKFPPDTFSVGDDSRKATVLLLHRHEKSEKKSDVRLVAWNTIADIVGGLLPGDVVKVKGELEQNKYLKKDTEEWVDKGLVVKAFFVEKTGAVAAAPLPEGVSEPVAAGGGGLGAPIPDSEIPFL